MSNSKGILISLLVLGLLVSPFVVLANTPDNSTRYFIKSKSIFWRNYFSVRHTFNNGFSAELSDWQVRLGRIFNLEIEPVKILFVLPEPEKENSDSEKLNSEPIESGRIDKTKKDRISPSEQVPWGIKAVYRNPDLSKTNGGEGVFVAVLDTGVSVSHPDLKNRIKDCRDFTHPRTPIVNGKCEDKNGHGTHVAGIIAADGGSDGLGIYGISPDSGLLAYRVCSTSGFCYADDISMAMKIAADRGANIINLSLGSDSPSSLVKEGVDYAVSKGALIVAAAGNDGPYFGSIDYPAAHVPVIGVGSFDSSILVADWSSRGINSTTTPYVKEERDIEFAMPGVNIESTWKDGKYAILSGTSMAAPHLAGLAAKLWQFEADNPAEKTRELLRTFVDDIDVEGDDDASGWGFPFIP